MVHSKVCSELTVRSRFSDAMLTLHMLSRRHLEEKIKGKKTRPGLLRSLVRRQYIASLEIFHSCPQLCCSNPTTNRTNTNGLPHVILPLECTRARLNTIKHKVDAADSDLNSSPLSSLPPSSSSFLSSRNEPQDHTIPHTIDNIKPS